jgi:uncharacterized membrane protein YfcA
MPYSIHIWTLAIVASFFVGLSKGGLANVGVVAVPIMSLVMSPVAAAGLLLPIFVVSDVFGVWIYRRRYSARNLGILIPSGLGGVLLGWVVASRISDAVASIIVGLVGCGFVVLLLWRRRYPPNPRGADVARGLVWGVATGFTSFITHSGAATFQIFILPQKLDKAVFAGTSTLTFAAINLAKIVPYWSLGQLSPVSISTALVLVPSALLGTIVGAKVTQKLPTAWFFSLVQIALLLVSILLLYQGMTTFLFG